MKAEQYQVLKKVDEFRDKWKQKTSDRPSYKLARWLLTPSERQSVQLLFSAESFAKTKRLSDVFFTSAIPFKKDENFSKTQVELGIKSWEKGYSKLPAEIVAIDWGQTYFKQQLKKNDTNFDDLFIHYLESFLQNVINQPITLIYVLTSEEVDSYPHLNQWILKITKKLPKKIKLSVIDHLEKPLFDESCLELQDKSITIRGGDLSLSQFEFESSFVGGRGDKFSDLRRILVQLSLSASQNKPKQVEEYGNQGIELARKIKTYFTLSYAYLAWGIAYITLRNAHKAHETLDKAILYAQTGLDKGENTESTAKENSEYEEDTDPHRQINQISDGNTALILIESYAAKASIYFNERDHKNTAFFMEKIFHLGIQYKNYTRAIFGASFAAISYHMMGNESHKKSIVKLGFETRKKLSEEHKPDHTSTELLCLGWLYYEMNLFVEEGRTKEETENEMIGIFGIDWKNHEILKLSHLK